MSYDLKIFFPQATFPRTEWRDILVGFQGPECLVRFDGPGDAHDPQPSCYLVADDSVLSADVCPIEPGECGVGSESARWMAVLSTSMGRSLKAFWIQFAIPHHVLVLLPGIKVHVEPGRLFANAESWLKFSQERLWSPLPRKKELVELGLFTPDGSPRF
jgi:hypothetical protein